MLDKNHTTLNIKF